MLVADLAKFTLQLTIVAILFRIAQGWLEVNRPNSELSKVLAFIY